GQANYSAAKAGLVGLTKTVAKEWGQFKINVNAVAFGFIETRLTAAKEEAGTFKKDGEEVQLGIPAQQREMARFILPPQRPGTRARNRSSSPWRTRCPSGAACRSRSPRSSCAPAARRGRADSTRTSRHRGSRLCSRSQRRGR